jgi:hypothetical protein
MQSIIIIIPYFGKWPVWMELYLDSIKRNPSIDFLFITDCDTSLLEGIANVAFEKTTFENYVERYKTVLGNDIQIPTAYKICDLRPFFSLIHQKNIDAYDFFGWADVDLLFGDIRSFYTKKILSNYDVISTHKTRLSGHLALLKNTKKNKTIGLSIYQWKQALQNPNFVGIDEHGITNALQMTLFDKVAEKFKVSTNYSILKVLRKMKTRKHYFVEQYTTPFTPIPWIDGTLNSHQPSEWYYEKGIITNSSDTNRRFIYIHFMNFKSSIWRADGTSAPWEDGFIYSVDDLIQRIRIDVNGIIVVER